MAQTLEREPQFGQAPAQLQPELGEMSMGQVEFSKREPLFSHPFIRRLAAGASVLAMSGVFAESAAAQDPQPQVTTVTTMKTEQGTISARDAAQKKIYLLEDVHAKGKVHMNDCHWTKGGFTNSGRDANGKIIYFHDKKRGYLCRDDKSPTGWVKMKGGTTGRKCKNPAKEHGKAPGPMAHGKVEVLRTLHTNFQLNSVAKAIVQKSCGTATAEAEVHQNFNLYSWLRLKGNGRIRSILNLEDSASTSAISHVECNETTSTTTTTTPGTTPPTPPPAQEFKHICTQKDFVESIDNSGHVSTTGSVNIGDTVEWSIKDWACNGSQDITNWNVKDVLPQGSTFIGSSMPLGSQVDNSSRTATWPGKGTLKADGTVVSFTFESQVNADTPCYTNLRNVEDSTAVGWNTAEDDAFIKLNNTNPGNNCPPPPGGSGGPGQ
jgi:hypothetical protein